MAILNTSTVIVPAIEVPEKEFPHIWIKSIRIDAPTTTKGRAFFELCPFNASTGEILDQPRIVTVKDLWAKVAESPEFQAAMGAIIAAVDTIK